MMLNHGVLREGGSLPGRAALERELLLRGRKTWMPQAPGLSLLFLASCHHGPHRSDPIADEQKALSDVPAPAPRWFPADESLPSLHWRCFRGRDKLGVSLWRKTGALLAALYRTFPSKRLFLKIDSDTLLLPRALLAFLRALHGATPRGTPLYFGSNRIASRRLFCSHRGCLLNTPRWRAMQRQMLPLANGTGLGTGLGNGLGDEDGGGGRQPPSSRRVCASTDASYAQGGAYGFDRRALGALAAGACLERAAAAVARHDGAAEPMLFEDEAVGLCMALHDVRLVTCGCFYDWGPCDITRPTAPPPHGCAPDTNASRLCHLPLTVHKLRKLAWFDGWWQLLAARQQPAMAALEHWQANLAQREGTGRAR
jgi:hypothetical protein